MTVVVFETPGLIDVRAFTIMGAHAKPNSPNPIGYFGTGLKYAIAVLVRLGAEPIVWIGRDKFVFSKKASKFRGSDLETIKMSVLKAGNRRPTNYELAYTTRYGANWKPWMAFRELESNTRDERGRTYLLDAEETGSEGVTRIVVDQPDFLEAAKAIDSIFLPRGRRTGALLDALPAPEEGCSYLYYRTMRAKDLGKPTLFTYNVVEAVTLTEDRQIAYEFQVRSILAKWVLTEATEAEVEKITTADDEWWESGLEFPPEVSPSAAFRAVALRRPKGFSRHAHGYWSGWSGPRERRPKAAFSLFSHHPRPWRLSGDYVFDAEGVVVFERPEDSYHVHWEDAAIAILERFDAAPGEEKEPSDADPAEPVLDEELPPPEDTPCPPDPESGEFSRGADAPPLEPF